MNEYGFQFDVGDVVMLKTAANVEYDEWKHLWQARSRLPLCGTVTECLLQKCPGGVQRSYSVRFANGESLTQVQRMQEIELVVFDQKEWMQRQDEFSRRREREFKEKHKPTDDV